jgi:diguanylate cyclase (GGDEF)-like protein
VKKLLELWNATPKPFVILASAFVFILLAWIDYRTGKAIRFSIFYWIPIAAATWRAGSRWGITFCAASAVARLWTDWHDMLAKGNVRYIALDFIFWFASFSILCLLLAKLRELLEMQEALAHTDHTTGMPNARAFSHHIDREMSRSRKTGVPLSLAYMDVDNFKGINDRYGHDAGDELLRDVAAAARASLRAGDVMARLGGDEFAILLPATGEHEAWKAMERFRESLMDGASRKFPATISIGLVTACDGNFAADDLLSTADSLMYEVKGAGKNDIRQRVLDSGK